MKSVTAIRHVQFEDLGAFETVLVANGYEIRYCDAGIDDLRGPEIANCDLLAVLGAPIGVYEEDKYPFLTDEITLIQRRLNSKRATIGICLGAQLLARSLGSRVYPGSTKEIGWNPLTLTKAGLYSPVRYFQSVPVLHWHGDTFDLPPGAQLLASTPICHNQAFSLGKTVLAFQFHPEASTRNFERWLIGHAVEISTGGFSVGQLRADSARFAPQSELVAQRCLCEWLQSLDPVEPTQQHVLGSHG